MKRIKVTYKGNVQGVGFRFTAKQLASGIGVNGFVKNLPDGTVLLVAEGAEDQLNNLLKSINDGMTGYISDADIKWTKASGEFKSFGVSF